MITRRHLLAGGVPGLIFPLANRTFAFGQPGFYGAWNGTLVSGSVRMRLLFQITTGPAATLTSLDEHNDIRAAKKVKIDGNEIVIGFPDILANFSGKLQDDRIVGEWHQGFQTIPLVLTRGPLDGASLGTGKVLDSKRLSALRQSKRLPALGVAWQSAKRGPTVLVDGVRSVESAVQVQADDQWHVGSLTKAMTATLVACCVDAGVARWEDTVGEVLGPTIPHLHDGYSEATFLHLLSHQSGMPENVPGSVLSTMSFAELADGRHDRHRFVAAALDQEPEGRLGDHFQYSNSGYVVAGAMLEELTGQPFETLMRERLFTPLKMRSAGFGPPDPGVSLNQPLGHYEPDWTWKDGRPINPVWPGRNKRPADNCFAFGPAGRAHVNLSDLLRFLTAHRDWNDDLLPAAEWKRLHTKHFGGSYALGWEVRGDGALWHNGSNTYWYGEALVDRAKGVACAALSNDGVVEISQTVVGQALMDGIYTAKAESRS